MRGGRGGGDGPARPAPEFARAGPSGGAVASSALKLPLFWVFFFGFERPLNPLGGGKPAPERLA